MTSPTAFDNIDPRTSEPRVVRAIVEIPKGRRSKIELDKETGLFKLDRFLYSSSHYPGDYGFLPRTLAEDGDALDILVMVSEPTFTGCLIESRVVGVFRMRDRGSADYKVLAVPSRDPLFAEYHELKDVPPHFLREVEHFFLTYKQLEGGVTEADGWGDVEEALQVIDASVARRT
ncbi:MAG: inorganic pyrophosphatase [Gemmatimonadota bacterium]|nr:MAG: inorganic pyrophosphatase [Gemmatimonadota bacterium]